MAVFALNNHNPPVLTFINSFKQVFYAIERLLNIYIRHAYFVKVLYLVVCSLLHNSKSTAQQLKIKRNMRQKHESNASVFHTEKGGAVPTLAHQA